MICGLPSIQRKGGRELPVLSMLATGVPAKKPTPRPRFLPLGSARNVAVIDVRSTRCVSGGIGGHLHGEVQRQRLTQWTEPARPGNNTPRNHEDMYGIPFAFASRSAIHSRRLPQHFLSRARAFPPRCSSRAPTPFRRRWVMRNDSLYRLGGYALVAGSIAAGLALMLHAPQPTDLSAYSALGMGTWMAAHWMFAIASVLMAGGFTAFARHMARTAGEGWSVLGLACALVTSALFVAIVAPEIVGFDTLRTMNAGAGNVGAQHAFIAINLNLMSLVHVTGPLFWGGVGCYSLAMTKDAMWPRWVGFAGLAIALIEIVANWAVGENFLAFQLIFAAGCLYLAYAGFLFSRMAAGKGVTAPHGAYKPSDAATTAKR